MSSSPIPRGPSGRPYDFQTVSDLRRRAPRDLADLLAQRAEWLLPEDRALIRALYVDNLTARHIAQLRGASPRSVRRRVHTLVQRLLSPRYEFVARQLERWSPTRARVARACVLEGHTLRAAAERLNVSLHTVRRHMDAVAAQHEALRA